MFAKHQVVIAKYRMISGITKDEFSVGGMTIYRGSSPQGSANPGDIFITPTGIFVYSNEWIPEKSAGFVIRSVFSGSTAIVEKSTDYVGIVSGAQAPTQIELPVANIGHELIIADETNIGGKHPIIVSFQDNEIIRVGSNYGSVTLSFDNGWRVLEKNINIIFVDTINTKIDTIDRTIDEDTL